MTAVRVRAKARADVEILIWIFSFSFSGRTRVVCQNTGGTVRVQGEFSLYPTQRVGFSFKRSKLDLMRPFATEIRPHR